MSDRLPGKADHVGVFHCHGCGALVYGVSPRLRDKSNRPRMIRSKNLDLYLCTTCRRKAGAYERKL